MGLVYKAAPQNRFTIISNKLIRDTAITDTAFRLISWIQSHTDGFKVSFGGIRKCLGYGIDKIRSAIHSAEENDYLIRKRTRTERGTFEWEYYVFASREDCLEFKAQEAENQPGQGSQGDDSTEEKPGTENPTMDATPHIKRTKKKEKRKIYKKEKEENLNSEEIPEPEPTEATSPPIKEEEIPADKPSESAKAIVTANENDSQNKIDPFFNRQQRPNERAWDWLADGPWKLPSGKLDENFRDAVANQFLKSMDKIKNIHEARAAVLSYFKKDPANLAIRWEAYHAEFLHKAANVQVRKEHGLQTANDEQDIIKHQRAATPLPEEQSVTESSTAAEKIANSADYAAPYLEVEQVSLPEGSENVQSARVIAATEADKTYWDRFRRNSPKEEKKVSCSELEAAKAAMAALKAKKQAENPRGRDKAVPSSLGEILSPQAQFQKLLQDMKKYLQSGIDELRQRAIDWAAEENGCELVKNEAGKIIDIREICF